MLKNFFLITYRSMMKNKLFIFINIFGMGVAIAQCIVGYFAYEYDKTFDDIHTNGASIYRVGCYRTFENDLTHFGYASYPLGELVDKTFQDVDQASRYLNSFSNFKRENDLFDANLKYPDPEFFQLFTFDLVSGNPNELKDKAS